MHVPSAKCHLISVLVLSDSTTTTIIHKLISYLPGFGTLILIPQDAKKHAQEYAYILRPINSHLYLVHVKHSMALHNVQGVSARHRAGQKAL